MRTPTPIQHLILAKRSGIALLVFAFGLLALPAAWTVSGLYFRSGSPISWRPALDHFELGAAAFGLGCCLVAPSLPKIPGSQKLLLSVVALLLYVLDLFLSMFASIFVFGFQG